MSNNVNTPCNHKCKDKTACKHACCKRTPNGKKDKPVSPGNTDGSGDSMRKPRFELDGAGSDSESQGDDNPDSQQQFVDSLAKAMTKSFKAGLSEQTKPKGDRTALIFKKRLERIEPLKLTDITDVAKIVSVMREMGLFAEGDNFAFAKEALMSIWPENGLGSAGHDDVVSQYEYNAYCRTLMRKVCIDPIMSMNDILENSPERAHKESLNAYYQRFASLLRDAIWLREVNQKPIDKEWLTPKLKAWIHKLNSWASVHVKRMVPGSSLEEIFTDSQGLIEGSSLDNNMSRHQLQGKSSMHHMREQRIDETNSDSQAPTTEIKQALNALGDRLEATKEETRNALFEMKESMETPLGKRGSQQPQGNEQNGNECAICPYPRNKSHPTERCFSNRNNNKQQASGAECYNCGKPGHFARDCTTRGRKREQRDYDSGNAGCAKCGRNNHSTAECRAQQKRPDVECHNCGKRGHYARDCKGQGNARGRNVSDVECHNLQLTVYCSAFLKF